MELNANLDQRAVVRSAQLEWGASPTKGVQRRMLDGREVATVWVRTRHLRHVARPSFATNNFVPNSGQNVGG